MNRSRLAKQLKRHEGFRGDPYKDSEGNWTIGYGHLLHLDKVRARTWLKRDIDKAEQECRRCLNFFDNLNSVRQEVMVNMMFNLGWPRLKTFKKMIAAAEAGDHELVGAEMLDSRWHRQVKGRAVELAAQYRTGEE
jgi:lysozyme